MTKNFDILISSILEDIGVADVLGNDGAYDTSDGRTPYISGMYTRNSRRSIKKKKTKKCHCK